MEKNNVTEFEIKKSKSNIIWEEAYKIKMGERLYRDKPHNSILDFLFGIRLHDLIMERIEDVKFYFSDPNELNLYED
jgi:hypothetical protein